MTEPGKNTKASEQRALTQIEGPELFIGLVGAVGTNLRLVIDTLSTEFREVNYEPYEVRVSGLLAGIPKFNYLQALHGGPEDERINNFMKAGDELRRAMKSGDGLALLSIMAIMDHREQNQGGQDKPIPRRVYILNSLKHPDEIATLRRIYGRAFSVVSVYAPRSERIDALAESIARSRHGFEKEQHRAEAEKLVEQDKNSGDDGFGQDVRDAFPLGDIFVGASDRVALKRDLKRFVELLFNHPFHTPTLDEYALYIADAAALRSADLSRQVGAVIANSDGDILAVGFNEVPKAGGGSVWPSDEHDYRDFQVGTDKSAMMKQEIVAEVFQRLSAAGWLADARSKAPISQLVEDALYSGDAILRDARIANIIEYGRINHAEMAALIDAVRRGVSVKGATLYCTTFPCHMCARHLIGAGIERVVYIEPYPKSMAKDLYKRAIRVDEDSADEEAVNFESFVGIAPRKYAEVFKMPRRKDSRGNAVIWNKSAANPRLDRYVATYLQLEKTIRVYVSERRQEFGLAEQEKSEPKEGAKGA